MIDFNGINRTGNNLKRNKLLLALNSRLTRITHKRNIAMSYCNYERVMSLEEKMDNLLDRIKEEENNV